MHYLEEAIIDNQFAVHFVGNKGNDDALHISEKLHSPDEDLEIILRHYFLNPFKSEEYFQFQHETDLRMNEVYAYVKQIFDKPSSLHEQSGFLAKHLYNQSLHPKIKSGELYVVYFRDCMLNGETIDAVGLFKSENRDTFLDVDYTSSGIALKTKEGVNINKLDKGCLVFNTNEETGYLMAIADANRGTEAQYWRDDFLSVEPVRNEYHQTSEFLGMTKQYVTQQIPEEFEVGKADQIDMLNRSMEYFKKHETFVKEEFEEEVLGDKNVIESFRRFDQGYREEREMQLEDSFDISAQAVKKQARVYKSVLKLDKNFHVYIHGNRELIEQGVDENGRKYYKIYYQEEA